MSGIKPDVVFWVSRIRTTFTDSAAPAQSQSFSGTGFWVRDRSQVAAFVTNRHMVDASFRKDLGLTHTLTDAAIEFRAFTQDVEGRGLNVHPLTEFFHIENVAQSLAVHPTADCAVFRSPATTRLFPFAWNPPAFSLESLADQHFFETSALIMDAASFIGFPSHDGEAWFDTRANQPIARLMSIASLPSQPFVNESLGRGWDDDAVLANGLSFSGSSGSPVVLHSKGIQVALPLTGYFVPATLIGIMSGHWSTPSAAGPRMLDHTGLSYFTRSTSILKLLT